VLGLLTCRDCSIDFYLLSSRWFRDPRTVGIPAIRRKMRLIECNAKSRYLKKLSCKGTLRQMFYLSEVPSPSMAPKSLLHTAYVYTVYLFTQGKGGEGRLTREKKVRGAIVHKAGRKYQHDGLNLLSIYSIKHQ
jgi:hypothetical protein